jgi:site-specific DNA recombinase
MAKGKADGRAVACYMRYSSHAQDSGCSIELQRAAITKAAGGPVREYIDAARTGRVVAGRAGLLKLLADAEAGQIGKLYVFKYDRLGRNLAGVALVCEQLEDLEVEVISCNEGSDQLTRGVHLVLAEYYSKNLAVLCRAGLVERFKQGCFVGGWAAIGYSIVKSGETSRLVVNPAEAAVVREVFEAYCEQGLGLRKLAALLNGRGLRTRRGTQFGQTSVAKILRNTTYIGQRTWGKVEHTLNRKTGASSNRRTPDNIIMDIQPDLRIIDDELWQRTQARLADRGTDGHKGVRGQVSAFTGLATCEVCGGPVFSKRVHQNKGTVIKANRYLACGHRVECKDGCSNKHYVRESVVLAGIQATFAALLDQQDQQDIIKEAVAEAKRLSDNNADALKLAREEVVKLESECARLLAMVIDEEVSPAAKRALSEQLTPRQEKLEQLRSQVGALAEDGNKTVAKLEVAVRAALDEARRSLAKVVSVEQLREFISTNVGPMMLTADGQVVQAPDGVSTAFHYARCSGR